MNEIEKSRLIKEDEKFFLHNRMSRFITISLVAIVSLAVLATGGRSLYYKLKADRLLSQARSFAASGNIPDAVLAAQTMLMLRPNDIGALEIMGDLAEKEGSPAAVALRARLAELDPATPERHLAYARTAMASGRFDLAREALAKVPPAGQSNPLYHNLQSTLFLRTADFPGAEKSAREAIRLAPGDSSAAFNLAVILIGSNDISKAEEINRILSQVDKDPAMRRPVRRMLVSLALQSGDMAGARAVASQLAGLPDAAIEDSIPLLDILQKTDPAAYAALLEKLRISAADDVPKLLPILQWMFANGEAEKVRAWIDALPQPQRDTAALRIARADALALTGAWDELATWLGGTQWTFGDFIRKAYLARALREIGDNFLWQARWREAFRDASTLPALLRALENTLSGWPGWETQRAETLWRLYESAQDHTALARLHDHYRRMRDASGLRKAVLQLLKHSPTDDGLKNNAAFLALLLRTDLPAARESARTAFEATPQDAARASTWALALLLDNDPAEALKVLDSLPEAARKDPGLAWTRGIVLAANGRAEEAKQILKSVNPATLLDVQEKLYLDALKSTVRSAPSPQLPPSGGL